MMIIAKAAEGKRKTLKRGEGGELKVLLCDVQIDGIITPILVDADGKIILTM